MNKPQNRFRRKKKNHRRGQALAMAAVSIVAVFAMGALAVDLGMAFAARAGAQRAADSGALAGASSFIDFSGNEAVDSANTRALEYATANDVLADPIQESQVTVWVIPDSQKVRVRVGAEDLPAWFARVLNVFSMDVAAVAAAVASDGGTSNQCVLPFAIPDLWFEGESDDNGNNIPDGDEDWSFDPTGTDDYLTLTEQPDGYSPCSKNATDCYDGTGLGSNLRNDFQNPVVDDVGREIWIKAGPRSTGGSGGMNDQVGPGNFLIWEMPDVSRDCQGRPGANWVHQNIMGCNECDVSVGTDYQTQPGNIASIKNPLKELMDSDPNAHWNGEEIVGSAFDVSPRIRIVPLWDPSQALQGKSTYQFNNFGKIFIESGGTQPPDFPIKARFLGVISGGSAGPNTGSLVKYLRLVQ